MPKLLSFLCAVTTLLSITITATALDNSLGNSFGKKRVKIQRLDQPQDIANSKLQNARARHTARLRQCNEKGDRNKQYCLQEADTQLRIDERRERAAQRRAAQD